MKKSALLALLPLVFTTQAFAEATDEGAAHLVAVFHTYLGSAEGVVTVAVEGDAYTVTLDAAPLAGMAAEAGGTASATPLVLTLTDNGDGTWGVTQDQSITLAFAIAGQSDYTSTFGSMTFDGVFDEALMTFSSGKGEMSDAKTVQKMTDPNMGEMSVETSIASMTYEMTGAAGASGGVDGTFTMSATGYSGSVLIPASEAMPPMTIGFTIDSVLQSGPTTGLRPDAFLKALSWVVANPSEDAMMANKAAMKTILSDGIPLFDNVTADMVAKGIAVTTPMGDVGIAEAAVLVDINGLVAEGKFREAISISGLTLPEGVIPPWAVPILPKDISVDIQVTDFDAAAAVQVALGLFDLPAGTGPDDAFQASLLAALMPNQTVTIGLNPGGISGDGYALTYEGSMVAGPEQPMPTGTALITLTGLDKLQAALDAAPDDIKGQAMMGVGMAQGMAKQDGDKLVWEIDASTPGTVSVNGVPMMGGN